MTWTKLVQREGDFFKNNLMHESLIDEYPNVFDSKHIGFMTTRNENKFIHYYHNSDMDLFFDFLKLKINENPNFFNEVIEDGKKHFFNLINFSQEIKNSDLRNKKVNELIELLNNYSKLYKKPYPFFHISAFVGLKKEFSEQHLDKLAMFRYFSRESFNKVHSLTGPLFDEIKFRLEFAKNNIKSFKTNEIVELLNFSKKIVDRQKCYLIHEDGKTILKENSEFIHEENNLNEFEISSNELKGTCIYHGSYKGIVKIINKNEDFVNINYGDIVVSSIITPSIIYHIKKAAAIITEEGGLTCHAAIIGKELRIPTIIGVKNVSNILRDGELVEVDAIKGIINKLDNK